jgi:predicted ferric reductase
VVDASLPGDDRRTRALPVIEARHTGTIPVITTAPAVPVRRPPGRRPRPDGSLLVREAAPVTARRVGALLAFWVGLVVSVGLWWMDTPARSLDGAGPLCIGVGRITGMVGGYVLLVQILVMSRAAWLERWLGGHRLMLWHRELGGYLVFAVLAHVAFTVVGYAQADQTPLGTESWTMLTTFQDMISATIATGLLVTIGFLCVKGVRRVLPYETWYYLHLTSYLVLLLGYGHQFALGQELANRSTLGHRVWLGFYLFVLANLAWGRVLGPVLFNLRHRLRVVEVVPESTDMVSIYISGHRLDRVRARAGQYFRWRFLTTGLWWQAHPFSLSAAPNPAWLRLTVKAVGDHTEELQGLHPGVRVFAEGPSGVFTADRRTRYRALLIAGGSGIAPIRALLEELPPGAVVIYRAGSEDELLFRQELDWLARERGARVHYVVGARDDPYPRRVLSPKGLRELVKDIGRRDVYLCGPEGLVSAALAALRRLRVPKRQIHLDPFEF